MRGELLMEEHLVDVVGVLILLVEAAGVLFIFAGAASGFVRVVANYRTQRASNFEPVRAELGRFMLVGLEFQLASDLLRTAVAPSFASIGRLAAVAAIRIVLDFFLGRQVGQRHRAAAEAVVPSTTEGSAHERR